MFRRLTAKKLKPGIILCRQRVHYTYCGTEECTDLFLLVSLVLQKSRERRHNPKKFYWDLTLMRLENGQVTQVPYAIENLERDFRIV